MFNKPALTLFFVLSCLFCNAAHIGRVITIPIKTRTSLTRSDGVFDTAKALLSIAATRSKHRQNLINFHCNRDAGISFKSPEIDNTSTIPNTTGSEPLLDFGETAWSGNITIGNPPKSFIVDVDTASADLWVSSTACLDSYCQGKNQYHSSASTTSQRQPGTFHIVYGNNASVDGNIYTDTVTVAGVTVENQYFAAATNVTLEPTQAPKDGVFGLAWPQIARLQEQPFFFNAISQGVIAKPVFALFLSNTSGSELHLGGVNPSLFVPPIEPHPLSPQTQGFWKIFNGTVVVNGEEVWNEMETVIDSGTTLMFGPSDAVQSVYAQVPGAKPFDAIPGAYQFPCNSVPKLSFGWGGNQWEIAEWNFNLGQTANGSTDCVGSLMVESFNLGNNTWLLGDRFLSNVYTVFDVQSKSVGFAQLPYN